MIRSLISKILQLAAFALIILVLTIIPIEFYVRNYIINQDFSIYKVQEDTFPLFHLVDNFSSPMYNIDHARRETSLRGARQHSIGFIGDSVTFGSGVTDDDNFVELLQRGQEGFDAYNFGVPGYGIIEIASVMQQALGHYEPQTVVYTFNFNDIHPMTSGYLSLLKSPENRFSSIDHFQGLWGTCKLFAKDHLKSIFVFKSLLQNSSTWRLTTTAPASSPFTKPEAKCRDELVLDSRLAEHQEILNFWVKMYADRDLRQKLSQTLVEMNNYARTRGTRLILLTFFDFHVMEQYPTELRDAIDAVVAETDLEYIDTFPLFRRHYGDCGFYSDIGHPGTLGNQLMADLILDHLRSSND